MTKPTKKTLEYYDWGSVEEYFIDNKIWDEELKCDVWTELCKSNDIENGKPFTLTNWELKYDNGKFTHILSDIMKDVIPDLLKHFGEPDKNCLIPGVLTATFIATW